MSSGSGNFDVDKLLNSLFKPEYDPEKESLKKLFDRRIKELGIAPTNVLILLKIEYRTLNGILNGTLKRVDLTNLIKIANFLQLPKEQIVQLYVETLEQNMLKEMLPTSEKVEFIKENFDLAALRKAGFIDTVTDFDLIEKKLVSYFGLSSIDEYKKPHVDVAFSAGLTKPKNELVRTTWIYSAEKIFKEINNPNAFERQKLIDYFPKIRWHSRDIDLGLISIIRDLYKIGITIIYQESLPSLHLRGATFSVNNKPCIVITNYAGFYPTLWFTLIHELFHVLFDWEEIDTNKYHLSDEDSEQLSVIEKEKEADNFAREYLFSKEKTMKIKPYIYDLDAVAEFSKHNHIHPSFIYVFYAWDVGKKNRSAWALAKKMNPEFQPLLSKLGSSWSQSKSIKDRVRSMSLNLFK